MNVNQIYPHHSGQFKIHVPYFLKRMDRKSRSYALTKYDWLEVYEEGSDVDPEELQEIISSDIQTFQAEEDESWKPYVGAWS